MTSHTITFESRDPLDTDRLGATLAATLPDPAIVALCGTLGAGKTRLAQAIAAGCGIDRAEVVSPTFVLCQEHHGDRSLFHFDAYRLNDDKEFLALGPDEYFQSPGITLIEWADRVESCLPAERLRIDIEVTGETSRQIRLTTFGERYLPVLAAVEAANRAAGR